MAKYAKYGLWGAFWVREIWSTRVNWLWSVIRPLLTVFRPDMERLRLVEANDRSLEMKMIINQVLGSFFAFVYSYQ